MPLLFKGKQDHLHSKAQINQHTNIWGIINVIQTKSDSRGPGQWKWMERLVSCWLSFTKPLPSSCKMMCILTKGTQLHILKTRAQVLWLEGTCSFHQHSDVTFSMHPPSLWWWRNRSCTFSSMEKKKKWCFLKQNTMLSLPLKNRAFVPGNSYQSLVFLFICLFADLKSLLCSD